MSDSRTAADARNDEIRDDVEGGLEPSPPMVSDGRLPYSAPRIEYLGRLETMAADCSAAGGKSDATCITGFS